MAYIYSDIIDQNGDLKADLSQMNYSGPVCELYESSSEFDLFIELPGVDPDDVSVDLEYGRLVISGIKSARRSQGKALRLSEVYSGQFRRSFELPEEIDPDKIKAEHDNGVLNIKMYKMASQIK